MEYIFMNREGQSFTRASHVGTTTLIGMRIVSVTFESREELQKLFTPEGQKWVHSTLIPAFRK